MPSMNSYSYIHNHKILKDKPNETGISNYNYRNKDACPLPSSCQTKFINYQANIDCYIVRCKQNFTLTHLKQHLKIVSGIIRSCSTTLNPKMMRNYQNNLGKSKSVIKQQKLHGKLSEYAVLTIQTIRVAFYV